MVHVFMLSLKLNDWFVKVYIGIPLAFRWAKKKHSHAIEWSCLLLAVLETARKGECHD
jgi:hypothetical protein